MLWQLAKQFKTAQKRFQLTVVARACLFGLYSSVAGAERVCSSLAKYILTVPRNKYCIGQYLKMKLHDLLKCRTTDPCGKF